MSQIPKISKNDQYGDITFFDIDYSIKKKNDF